VTGTELARLLKRLGLTARAAAEQLDVQKSAVNHWLAGRRPVPGPVAAAVRCWLQRGKV